MLTYFVRRLLVLIPIFVMTSFLIWGIVYTSPNGGALNNYIHPGQTLTPVQIAALRHRLGIDQPLPIRYGTWLLAVLHGDLGASVVSGTSVAEALPERASATLLLLVPAFLAQEGLAIVLGIFLASKSVTFLAKALSTLSLIFYVLPLFWLGFIAIALVGTLFTWLPLGGIVDLRLTSAPFGTPAYGIFFRDHPIVAFVDLLCHLFLPFVVLTLTGLAFDSRLVQGQMQIALHEDYVRTARAKGVPEHAVIWKHAFRNALLPLVTSIGLQVPGLLAGTVVVETLFSWPGMGRLYLQSALQHDYPIVVAISLVISVVILVTNLLTDLAYALLDPRIHYQR